jgi:hypothetical protein
VELPEEHAEHHVAVLPTKLLRQLAGRRRIPRREGAERPRFERRPTAGMIRDQPLEMSVGGALALAAMDPELRIYVTSRGELGDSAIEVNVVSSEPQPVELTGGAVVLEPVNLTRQATEQLLAERRALARRGQESTTTADAYCLELLRELPTAGTVFRIAGAELQQRYAPIQGVLDAARKIRDVGQLAPDSDPEGYFHSIRQWAIWSLEERLDEDEFGEAFLEQTRKNFDNLGREWTDEVEELVRGLVPNRWRDIQKVLEAAQTGPGSP